MTSPALLHRRTHWIYVGDMQEDYKALRHRERPEKLEQLSEAATAALDQPCTIIVLLRINSNVDCSYLSISYKTVEYSYVLMVS
jgi:hypothetical protein